MSLYNFQNFLLDTNAVIALTRPDSLEFQQIAPKIASLHSEAKLSISIISIYEMEYGVAHASVPEIARKAKGAIQRLDAENKITILPLTMLGAKIFGNIKEQYRSAKLIGKKALQKHNIDLIIAATAIEHQATLVSHDNKDKIFEILSENRGDFFWEDWISDFNHKNGQP